jgi:Zn-dependent peptidase ImmA (M78 family)
VLTQAEIGRTLRTAREAAGVSIEIAAAASGLTEELVRGCEDGSDLTAARVASLATIYGYSEESLLLGKPYDTSVSVLLRGDPRAAELILHLGRLASICREHTFLEDLLGMPARGRVAGFAPAGPPPPPPFQHAEELANRTREELDLGQAPIRSVSGLFEELGIRLVWTDQLPETIHGMSLHDPALGPSVIANLTGRRQAWWTLRSTLAHELCHILYDRQPAAPLGIASRRDQRDDIEQRANAFGIYFLAPREGVQRLLMSRGCRPYTLDRTDVHAVMMHFGLGKEATTFHLKHLDWLTAEQRADLLAHRYPTEPADDTESPDAQPDLQPYISLGVDLERLSLVRPAVRAYERGLITSGRLREALQLSPFAELEPVLAS